ncbi:hypothetical protein CJ030_MR8G006230 [Morella rubra]|uniref:PB1-like domain-containing protein n=1 Tax=Morella rubra TaxID=262757 RepID=A0A6A1UQ70_9ROSI|nr:hypothetical protein CJ030_MR8G006229 [Morella rubra]KAB1202480.1 hypothetical protein CJ030_MR8G006230 [Morella rubra]
MGDGLFYFEVHQDGKFNRYDGCNYENETVNVHGEPYDPYCLSFFEVEDIVKNYGYKSGDLSYYKESSIDLVDGLHLLSSDQDVLWMVSTLEGQHMFVLYVVSF